MFFLRKLNNKDKKSANPDKGDFFNSVPNEIIFYIMTFLDGQSFGRLAMTSTAFNKLAEEISGKSQIQYAKTIGGVRCEGTYAQLQSKYKHYRIAAQKREKEIEEIEKMRKSIQENERAFGLGSNLPPCVAEEERCAAGVCCVVGCIGGIIVSSFTAFSCPVTSLLGAGLGTGTSWVGCRTGRCICGVCLECKREGLDERESRLNADFPEPVAMLK